MCVCVCVSLFFFGKGHSCTFEWQHLSTFQQISQRTCALWPGTHLFPPMRSWPSCLIACLRMPLLISLCSRPLRGSLCDNLQLAPPKLLTEPRSFQQLLRHLSTDLEPKVWISVAVPSRGVLNQCLAHALEKLVCCSNAFWSVGGSHMSCGSSVWKQACHQLAQTRLDSRTP